MKRIDWIVLIIIVVISIVVLKDLFKPGFYTSHDGPHQIVRLYYFDQALKDGQIPPRWAGGLLNGFGYPLFIFSYHVPWIIAEPLHLAGLSIIDSVKMTFLIGFILSGITMYIFQKEVFGRIAAIGGTVLYLFAPYRFSNIFVRAAIGDATSFIFVPLLFLSLYKLKNEARINFKWILIGSASLALLLLSHALVFFFYMIGFIIYSLFSIFTIRNKKTFIISEILILVCSFGLSSYYLIPSLIERKLTIFASTMSQMILGGGEFLNVKDILYTAWGYGMFHAQEGAMSLQLGIAQWVVVILSIVLLIYKARKGVKSLLKKPDALIFIIIFLFSIYLMFPISYPFWKAVSNIVVIDFPWRVLTLSIFSVSYLGGFLIHSIKLEKLRITLLIFLLALAVYANRNHIHINKSLDWDIPFYLKLEKTTNSYDEYTPQWVDSGLVKDPKKKIVTSQNNAIVSNIKNTSNHIEFNIKTTTKTVAMINTIYYPGWKVYIDGRESKINYQNGGLMEVSVPKGNVKVNANFTKTPLRKVSDLITLISLGFLAAVVIKYHKTW